MPKLDLTRFYGLDHPLLYTNRSNLDAVRTLFAAEITAYAAHCRNNHELLDALYLAMPPESGFLFPKKIGQGSTRKAYQLPFGLVMKLERTDRLVPSEMSYRVCSDSYLHQRRRVSNFAELTTAIGHTQLVVRIYGAMLSFGNLPTLPTVLITERLMPLTEWDSDSLEGIDYQHLAVGADGRLKLFDTRFPMSNRTATDRPLKQVIPQTADGVWLGNIGVDHAGRYFLLDSGNNVWEPCSLTDSFLPDIPSESGGLGWVPCSPYSLLHLNQTVRLSEELFHIYEERRNSDGKEEDHANVQQSVTVDACG